MANKPVWEQAFIAGYTQGYKVGWNRVEFAPLGLEENAEFAYQQWWQKNLQLAEQLVIDCREEKSRCHHSELNQSERRT